MAPRFQPQYVPAKDLQFLKRGYDDAGHYRLVSDTSKFDRGLTQLMHVDLHWLDVPERVKFKLMSMVHNCLNHKAPR